MQLAACFVWSLAPVRPPAWCSRAAGWVSAKGRVPHTVLALLDTLRAHPGAVRRLTSNPLQSLVLAATLASGLLGGIG